MTSADEQLDPDAAFAGRVSDERAPFSLPTVAASAPVLIQLSREMRSLRDSTDDPTLREALTGVLDGRTSLSSIFSSGVLPEPPTEMPEGLRLILEADEETS